jgi:dTMP kinase
MRPADAMTPGPSRRRPLAGVFITLEGIDGCGKSTQARRLAEGLTARGADVLATREPGGTAVGQALRAVLLDRAHAALVPQVELLLYLADRVQHLSEVIRPALAAGRTVLCDRFHDATVAYQQHGRGLDFAPVAEIVAAYIAPTQPDLTLWLDVDVATAQARIMARTADDARQPAGAPTGGDRMDGEQTAFHERVRKGYLALHEAHPARIVRIDAAADEATVAAALWQALEARFDVS